LKLIGRNGDLYTLNIPAGALISPQKITMTEVVSFTSFPFAATAVAGVVIEPENLALDVPAQLSIRLAAAQTGPLAAVATDSAFEHYFLTPLVNRNGTNQIALNHTGEIALGLPTSAEIAQLRSQNPAQYADKLSQITAGLLFEQGTKAAPIKVARLHSAGITPPSDFETTFENQVYPGLLAADPTDSESLRTALNNYLIWWYDVGAFGAQDSFQIEIDQANAAAIAGIAARINYLEPKARAHDYDAIVRIFATRLAMTRVPWVTAYAPGQESILAEKIRKVLKFKLSLDSDLLLDSAVGQVHTRVTSSFNFSWGDLDLAGKDKGTGPLTYQTRSHYTPPAPCTVETGTPAPGDLSVFQLGFVAKQPPSPNGKFHLKDVYLLAWPDHITEGFQIICDSVSAPIEYWWAEFNVMHEDEITGYQPGTSVPRGAFDYGTSWVMRQSGSPIMGKKTYDRDRALNDSTLHETSKFTLEHTPE
jgi:hypothetical protein